MLAQELITLSKLRTAFNLNSTELETLITSLASHINPYILWHNAYQMHWKEDVESNATLLELETPTFPQISVEQFVLADCTKAMCNI